MVRRVRRHLTVPLGLTLTAVLVAAGCSAAIDAPPVKLPTTTVSPAAGSPSPTSTTTSTAPNDQPSVARPAHVPVIVIDPGHSGKVIRSVDRKTGLRDIDYPNYPEIYETFNISTCVALALRADGYVVKLTKRKALSNVGHRQRAAVANDSLADLAISVHNDHGASDTFEATYDQRGVPGPNGKYHEMYRGSGGHRTVFRDSAVAKKSQQFARIIARARSESQGLPVSVRENSFNGRAPLEPGNLALVQLFSKVPWVYNEMGARTGGNVRTTMTIRAETGYAQGLLAGVEEAVPLIPGEANRPTRSGDSLRPCLVRMRDAP